MTDAVDDSDVRGTVIDGWPRLPPPPLCGVRGDVAVVEDDVDEMDV